MSRFLGFIELTALWLMLTRPDWLYIQSGVIPFRINGDKLHIVLITTRKKHWTIPKGIVEAHLSPQQSAAREAYEEAGIRGRVYAESVGVYRYSKWNGICTVDVFPMEVIETLKKWPESDFRTRRWVSIPEALDLLHNKELCNIVRQFPDYLRL